LRVHLDLVVHPLPLLPCLGQHPLLHPDDGSLEQLFLSLPLLVLVLPLLPCPRQVEVAHPIQCTTDHVLLLGEHVGDRLPLLPGHGQQSVLHPADGTAQHLLLAPVLICVLLPLLPCFGESQVPHAVNSTVCDEVFVFRKLLQKFTDTSLQLSHFLFVSCSDLTLFFFEGSLDVGQFFLPLHVDFSLLPLVGGLHALHLLLHDFHLFDGCFHLLLCLPHFEFPLLDGLGQFVLQLLVLTLEFSDGAF